MYLGSNAIGLTPGYGPGRRLGATAADSGGGEGAGTPGASGDGKLGKGGKEGSFDKWKHSGFVVLSDVMAGLSMAVYQGLGKGNRGSALVRGVEATVISSLSRMATTAFDVFDFDQEPVIKQQVWVAVFSAVYSYYKNRNLPLATMEAVAADLVSQIMTGALSAKGDTILFGGDKSKV